MNEMLVFSPLALGAGFFGFLANSLLLFYLVKWTVMKASGEKSRRWRLLFLTLAKLGLLGGLSWWVLRHLNESPVWFLLGASLALGFVGAWGKWKVSR